MFTYVVVGLAVLLAYMVAMLRDILIIKNTEGAIYISGDKRVIVLHDLFGEHSSLLWFKWRVKRGSFKFNIVTRSIAIGDTRSLRRM